MSWHVYLVRCRDGSLYCGVARDVARRVAEHNSGAGARYVVPSRRPVACVWTRRARDRGDALRLELWLKRREAAVKRELAAGTRRLVRGRGDAPDLESAWRTVRRKTRDG